MVKQELGKSTEQTEGSKIGTDNGRRPQPAAVFFLAFHRALAAFFADAERWA